MSSCLRGSCHDLLASPPDLDLEPDLDHDVVDVAVAVAVGAIVLAEVVDRTVLGLFPSARIATKGYFLMFITRLLAVGLTLVLLAIRLILIIWLTLICHDYRLVVRALDNKRVQFKMGMAKRLGSQKCNMKRGAENGFGQCSARPFPTQLGIRGGMGDVAH